jgi:hypothetical protein
MTSRTAKSLARSLTGRLWRDTIRPCTMAPPAAIGGTAALAGDDWQVLAACRLKGTSK